jgi:hypothetical protein
MVHRARPGGPARKEVRGGGAGAWLSNGLVMVPPGLKRWLPRVGNGVREATDDGFLVWRPSASALGAGPGLAVVYAAVNVRLPGRQVSPAAPVSGLSPPKRTAGLFVVFSFWPTWRPRGTPLLPRADTADGSVDPFFSLYTLKQH